MTINQQQQQQHVEEFARIGALFNRVIATSSMREKDSGLTELKATSVEQVQTLENQLKYNEKKTTELAELQEKFDALQAEYDKMVMNKKLLGKLMERDLEIDQNKTVKQIQKFEENILKYSKLERPNLLKEALESHENKGILLYDVMNQRIEECIYALRKRILEVDKNQAFSAKITSEFGSTFGLIDTYDQLTKENKKLKDDEFHVSMDPLSKRRNITKMSNASARDLLAFLQQEYKTEVDSLKIMHADEKDENWKNFDDICKDENFNEPSPKSINEKEKKEVEEELADLLQKKKDLPEPVFDPTGKFKGRDGKLLELLTFLVKDMHKRNNEILETTKFIEEKTLELYEMAKSLRYEKLKYYYIFDPYYSLLGSHEQLMYNQQRNLSVLYTLASLSSSFSVSSEDMESYFRQKVQVLARMKKHQHEQELQRQQEQMPSQRGKKSKRLLSSPKNPDAKNRLMRILSMPASKYPKFEEETAAFDPNLVQKSTKILPRINFNIILNKNNIDLKNVEYHFTNFYSASILCELMAPLFKHPAKRLTEVWHQIYKGLISIVQDDFRIFSEDMHSQFDTIRKCSYRILSYEKADAESQTENKKFMDVEVQNEDKPLHPVPKKKEPVKKDKKK